MQVGDDQHLLLRPIQRAGDVGDECDIANTDVMAGHSRSKNGVLRDAYVPAIPLRREFLFPLIGITGTRPFGPAR
jgi:hypothetical protein